MNDIKKQGKYDETKKKIHELELMRLFWDKFLRFINQNKIIK